MLLWMQFYSATASGKLTVPHGYSTDELGNLLTHNESESFKWDDAVEPQVSVVDDRFKLSPQERVVASVNVLQILRITIFGSTRHFFHVFTMCHNLGLMTLILVWLSHKIGSICQVCDGVMNLGAYLYSTSTLSLFLLSPVTHCSAQKSLHFTKHSISTLCALCPLFHHL